MPAKKSAPSAEETAAKKKKAAPAKGKKAAVKTAENSTDAKKSTAKKAAAAKKTAAKKAPVYPDVTPAELKENVPGQSVAAEEEALSKTAIEAIDGAEVYQGIEKIQNEDKSSGQSEALNQIRTEGEKGAEIVKALEKEKPAAARKAPKKAAKKAAVKPDLPGVTAAELAENAPGQSVEAEEEALSKTAIEAEKGAEAYEAIEDIQKERKAKTAAKARKAAAAGSTEKSMNQIRTEGAKGTEIVKDLEEAKGKKSAPVQDAKTARKASAAKSRKSREEAALPPHSDAVTAPGQSEAQKEAALNDIRAEGEKGAAIVKALDSVKGAPDDKPLPEAEVEKTAAQGREELAAAAEKKAVNVIAEEDEAGKKVYEAIDKLAAEKEKAAPETKPAAKKPVLNMNDETIAYYMQYSPETLLEMVNAMGYPGDMEKLKADLTAAEDLAAFTEKAVLEDLPKAGEYSIEEDGFDVNALPVLFARVADTIPFKASDQAAFADKIKADTERMLINEGINDSAIYKDLMEDVRQVLMYAQRHNITTLEEMEKVIPADLKALIGRFMDVAYTMLPGWTYNDVKYYEGFLYGVLSQFADMTNWHNRAMMDVADLYIKHGDYGKGDADYNYVVRENSLKDQIYYRFADVYRPIDLQKAKSIAADALQVVDGRFEYYPKLLEILNS